MRCALILAALPACTSLLQPVRLTFRNVDNTTFTTSVSAIGAGVMPLHQNLGVHFRPYNREELHSVLANVSAGLQVLQDEEMENKEPTPWKTYWNSDLCLEKREKQKMDDYFMVCQKSTPVIWTPKHKFAYMKTPKAGSMAFQDFFRKHFSDSEDIKSQDLPDDVYVFTFVRNPFKQKLSGYAEIDLKTQAGKEMTLDNSTTFQHVHPDEDNGKARFAAFLDDILHRRFQKGDARKPQHVSNQLGHSLCSHSVNFFGQLEHLTKDWDQIQAEAKLPHEVRTKALPIVHAGEYPHHPLYKYDKSLPLGKALKEKICEIFSSEFACLGYDAPPYCQKYGLL